MNWLSTGGLVYFALTILVQVVVLLYDAERALSGLITVTEWATMYHDTWRAYLLVIGVASGAVGLAVHFIFFKP
jgi:hypothetical protein